jgi:hypothetical protein
MNDLFGVGYRFPPCGFPHEHVPGGKQQRDSSYLNDSSPIEYLPCRSNCTDSHLRNAPLEGTVDEALGPR